MTRRGVAVVFLFGLIVAATGTLDGRQNPPQTTRDPRTGQPVPPAGTGLIAGAVVSSDVGRAVVRARVVLSGGDRRISKSMLTDDQGRFNFADLGPGEYTLTASKPGYVESIYGQRQPGSGRPGTTIRLAAGQQMNRIALTLARGGVITGTVRDETGEPAYLTPVRVYRYTMRSGERTLQQAGSATTDDRGVYRVPVLLPGEYIVSATPRQDLESTQMGEYRIMIEELVAQRSVVADARAVELKMAAAQMVEAQESSGPSTGYAPVYYPGTPQASMAGSVTVGIGEERSGVDMQLQLVPTARVAGTVTGPVGPFAGAQVQLIDRSAPQGLNVRGARSNNMGRFSFTGIPPGQYTVLARATPKGGQPLEASGREAAEFLAMQTEAAKAAQVAAAIANAAQLWSMSEVVVDGRDQPNLFLTLQEGLTISGSVVFDGGGPAQNLSRMSVTTVPVGAGVGGELALAPPAPVDASGRFTIRGLIPGHYRVVPSAGVPPGFTIASSMFAGRDTLDFPLEVRPGGEIAGGVLTFNTRTTELSGALQDPTGQPAPGYTIVAFSSDERYWTPQSRRIQAARPATDGRFGFRGLPPGDYRLVAVIDVEPGQWFDPAFLRQLIGGSIALSIGDGEKKVQDIRVR